MQLSALVFSLSNICSKLAAFEPVLSEKFLFLYGSSLAIMVIYAIMWQKILSRVSLITAYSNRLMSMVWGVVWGMVLFHETIRWQTALGTCVIIIGLYIVVKSDE